MTSGPAGTLTYGPGMQAPTNPAPLHGVSGLGSATYPYDATGDRTAPDTTSATYDAERRLASWSTSRGTTGQEAYDGEGQRVAHQTTSGGSTTTTRYLGDLEEIDGATGTVTTYYSAAGTRVAMKVGSMLSYLATDGLGSIDLAVSGSGSVVAQQLYAPYGATRYSSGAMPTSRGFTGQRQDAASGLEYYGARYYDPAVFQFVSADSV